MLYSGICRNVEHHDLYLQQARCPEMEEEEGMQLSLDSSNIIMRLC